LKNFDPLYAANLTLGRSGWCSTVAQAISPNGRRGYLISADANAGDYIFHAKKALLGYGGPAPLWRTIESKRAPTLDALLSMIEPDVASMLGYSQAMAA
jgi:hypothetical protein